MATTVPNNPFDTQQSSTSGIVSKAMDNPSNNPSVAQYTPETRSIDANTQTVAGQVDSMLAKDSPLLQRARTLATQGMAQRGLVNSSMSQGAGTAAMIDRVTPMAQQDAATYNSTASENMAAKNNAGMFNTGEQNKFSLQTGSQMFTAQLEGAKQNFVSAQADLDRAQQTAMADKSIDSQKALQVAQQNFSSAQAALDRTQQTSLQTGQQDFTRSQTALDRTQQTSLQNDQQEFQQSQAAMERSQQLALQNDSQDFSALENKAARQLQVDMQQVAIKAQNAQIPATFAQNITNTAMSGVNAILADGALDKTAKQAAISNLVTYANSQITWANKFYGATVPAISSPTVA